MNDFDSTFQKPNHNNNGIMNFHMNNNNNNNNNNDSSNSNNINNNSMNNVNHMNYVGGNNHVGTIPFHQNGMMTTTTTITILPAIIPPTMPTIPTSVVGIGDISYVPSQIEEAYGMYLLETYFQQQPSSTITSTTNTTIHIPGKDAVLFFTKSKNINRQMLRTIWNIIDPYSIGFIQKPIQFYIVLRCIAFLQWNDQTNYCHFFTLIQQQQEMDEETLLKQCLQQTMNHRFEIQLAIFEGISIPTLQFLQEFYFTRKQQQQISQSQQQQVSPSQQQQQQQHQMMMTPAPVPTHLTTTMTSSSLLQQQQQSNQMSFQQIQEVVPLPPPPQSQLSGGVGVPVVVPPPSSISSSTTTMNTNPSHQLLLPTQLELTSIDDAFGSLIEIQEQPLPSFLGVSMGGVQEQEQQQQNSFITSSSPILQQQQDMAPTVPDTVPVNLDEEDDDDFGDFTTAHNPTATTTTTTTTTSTLPQLDQYNNHNHDTDPFNHFPTTSITSLSSSSSMILPQTTTTTPTPTLPVLNNQEENTIIRKKEDDMDDDDDFGEFTTVNSNNDENTMSTAVAVATTTAIIVSSSATVVVNNHGWDALDALIGDVVQDAPLPPLGLPPPPLPVVFPIPIHQEADEPQQQIEVPMMTTNTTTATVDDPSDSFGDFEGTIHVENTTTFLEGNIQEFGIITKDEKIINSSSVFIDIIVTKIDNKNNNNDDDDDEDFGDFNQVVDSMKMDSSSAAPVVVVENIALSSSSSYGWDALDALAEKETNQLSHLQKDVSTTTTTTTTTGTLQQQQLELLTTTTSGEEELATIPSPIIDDIISSTCVTKDIPNMETTTTMSFSSPPVVLLQGGSVVGWDAFDALDVTAVASGTTSFDNRNFIPSLPPNSTYELSGTIVTDKNRSTSGEEFVINENIGIRNVQQDSLNHPTSTTSTDVELSGWGALDALADPIIQQPMIPVVLQNTVSFDPSLDTNGMNNYESADSSSIPPPSNDDDTTDEFGDFEGTIVTSTSTTVVVEVGQQQLIDSTLLSQPAGWDAFDAIIEKPPLEEEEEGVPKSNRAIIDRIDSTYYSAATEYKSTSSNIVSDDEDFSTFVDAEDHVQQQEGEQQEEPVPMEQQMNNVLLLSSSSNKQVDNNDDPFSMFDSYSAPPPPLLPTITVGTVGETNGTDLFTFNSHTQDSRIEMNQTTETTKEIQGVVVVDDNNIYDDDTFGDFTEFQNVTNDEPGTEVGSRILDQQQQQQQQQTVVGVIKDDNNDNLLFDHFQVATTTTTTTILPPEEKNDLFGGFTPSKNPSPPPVVVVVETRNVDEFDDFGDFTTTSCQPIIIQQNKNVPLNDPLSSVFQIAKNATSSAQGFDSDFGDFGDFSSNPLRTDEEEENNKNKIHEQPLHVNTDRFQSENAIGDGNSTAVAVVNESDFGDFGDFTGNQTPMEQQNKNQIELESTLSQSTNAFTSTHNNSTTNNTEFESDFGDFEGITSTEWTGPNHSDSLVTSPVLQDNGNSDDDFDAFGDFTASGPPNVLDQVNSLNNEWSTNQPISLDRIDHEFQLEKQFIVAHGQKLDTKFRRILGSSIVLIDLGVSFETNIGSKSNNNNEKVNEKNRIRIQRCKHLLSLLTSSHTSLVSKLWESTIMITQNECLSAVSIFQEATRSFSSSPTDRMYIRKPFENYKNSLGEMIRVVRFIVCTIGDLLLVDPVVVLNDETLQSAWSSMALLKEVIQLEEMWIKIEKYSLDLQLKTSSIPSLQTIRLQTNNEGTSTDPENMCYLSLQSIGGTPSPPPPPPTQNSTLVPVQWKGKCFMACSANLLVNNGMVIE